MRLLRRINGWRWPGRLLAKTAVFLVTLAAVCFPFPRRLVDHVARWRNPNHLIEPDAAALRPWVEELRNQVGDKPAPQVMLQRVQQFVYKHLPYAWDWENWGNADYIPTVTEALQAGREDCDGRAVVAASLLTALGYNANIVTDFTHVWVATDYGQTMSPGAAQAVVAGESGLAVQPAAWKQVPRALSYGVRVFYLHRELILLAVCWLMWLRPGRSWMRNIAALVLMIGALILLRWGGRNVPPNAAMELTAVAGFMVAAVLMWRRNPRPVAQSAAVSAAPTS